jgi:hypothetical protein
MRVVLSARGCPRTAVFVLALALAHQGARAMQVPGVRETPPLEELWSEADIATSDVFLGAGGTEYLPAPQTAFRMLKKHVDGWEVRDPQGRAWSVKYGPEAQWEVVASRLVWALGYHQPPVYYVVYWTLPGGDRPGPQAPSRFRHELPDWKRTGRWSWSDSPFKDAPAHRGLLVLLRILNMPDILDRDTAIFTRKGEGHGPRRQYVAFDLAARMDIAEFEQQPFIQGVENGKVRFAEAGGRPRELFQNLTPADVRWTCERLNVLTDQQWRDVFRAAHYDEPTAARFIKKLREKVQAGLKLQ